MALLAPPTNTVVVETIVISAPGFSPAEVEDLVLVPLERAIAVLPGLQAVLGEARSGKATLHARFSPSVDRYVARRQLAAALQRNQSTLPDGVMPLLMSGAGTPSALFFTEPNQGLALRRTLQSTPGVQRVEICGVGASELTIELSADRLAAFKLNRQDLRDTIQTELGRALLSPMSSEDLGAVVVGTTTGGPIRLEDLATLVMRESGSCRCMIDGTAKACLKVWGDSAQVARHLNRWIDAPAAAHYHFPVGAQGAARPGIGLRWFDSKGPSMWLTPGPLPVRPGQPWPTTMKRPLTTLAVVGLEPAKRIQATLEKQGAHVEIEKPERQSEPEIRPNRVKLAQFGIPFMALTRQIRDAMAENEVLGTLTYGGARIDAVLLNTPPGTLAEVMINTPTGQLIPLTAVAKIQQRIRPASIQRLNAQRVTKIRIWGPPGLSFPAKSTRLDEGTPFFR